MRSFTKSTKCPIRAESIIVLLLILLVALSFNACLSDNRCGDGYISDPIKGCISGADEQGNNDALVEDSVEDAYTDDVASEEVDESSPEDPFKDQGKQCSQQSDCSRSSSACVIFPGATEGYCSMPECTLEPDNCPDGYYCFDATKVGQEVTICLQQ